jgi:putative hydrolase of the HAD superfamily
MRGVLFDFGGTLDTGGVHWSRKFEELYRSAGLPIRREALDAAFVWSEQQLLLDGEIPRATLRQTLDKQLALQFSFLRLEGKNGVRKEMLDRCYDDVVRTASAAAAVLSGARPEYRTGVVSNFYGNLSIVCEELGLAKHLDVMIDSALVGIRKPDPEIFRLAARKLPAAPAETFVVGDSYERDIVPAKSIGCRTIWLKGPGWSAPSSTAAADYTIESLEELKPILARAAAGGAQH